MKLRVGSQSGLVLRSGARPICGGVLVGICLTLRASRGLAKLKNAYFVLDMHDPLVYLVVCLLLTLAAVATLIPALRATGADPADALRRMNLSRLTSLTALIARSIELVGSERTTWIRSTAIRRVTRFIGSSNSTNAP